MKYTSTYLPTYYALRSKFQIGKSLKFAGCLVSDKGVQPDPDRLRFFLSCVFSSVAFFPQLRFFLSCIFSSDREGAKEETSANVL